MEGDIVFSGISGRFPEAASVEEFWENLVTGKDMVTSDNKRWVAGYAGLPQRKGTLSVPLEEFDAEFFSVNRKLAERLDPQLRLLLEVTWEAILDSGYNPGSLAGRKIGVFVGASSNATMEAARMSAADVSGYDLSTATCMLANRISFAFDFHGPSVVVDTYCSSSMLAVHAAVTAIRNGECEGAIVAGVNLLLNPFLSLQVFRCGPLSLDGKCKTFDATADGYVRSEAIVAAFITRRSLACRSYATVVHTKTNADGRKANGVTFPSGAAQEELMRQVYDEAQIRPDDVFYVEPHGTGTNAGDTEELGGISALFCQNRTSATPLLIGSSKSNMGHAEAAASLCAIFKVLLSIQRGLIPGNIHFQNPNPAVPALLDGRLKVVTRLTPVVGSIFGVSASGIGGSNAHLILKSEPNQSIPLLVDLPRVIPLSGRTNAAVEEGMKQIIQKRDNGMIDLLCKIHEKRTDGHEYRGFVLIKDNAGTGITSTAKPVSSLPPPLWFVFPGMGTQWAGMGKDIMRNEVICKSIEKSARIANSFGLDLVNILVNEPYEVLKQHLSLTFIAIGIALIEFMRSLNLRPDGFIGHSIGEFMCAYADDSLTQEEAIGFGHGKDVFLADFDNGGGMLAVGMTWEEAQAQCPPNILPSCHNAGDSVTVSGKVEDLRRWSQELKGKGIFAKEIETGGIPFHSQHVSSMVPGFRKICEKFISNGYRSSKWISTVIPKSEAESSTPQPFSAEYMTKNFESPVLFYEAVQCIPSDAVVVEIGSHSLFKNILKRTLPPTCTVVSTMNRNVKDSLVGLYDAVGTLFLAGLQPRLRDTSGIIHSRTSISSLVVWNHSEKFELMNYIPKASHGQKVIKVNLNEKKWNYLKGHQIDGRILFPATGYMVLAWEALGDLIGKDWKTLPVQFDNISFQRAVVLDFNSTHEFKLSFLESTGDFHVCESNMIVASGKIRTLDEVEVGTKRHVSDMKELELKTVDLYKDFRIRGYEYSGLFQGITRASTVGDFALIRWEYEWIPFLDALIQLELVSLHVSMTSIFVPTNVKKLVIEPQVFHSVQHNEPRAVSRCSLQKAISTVGVHMEGFKLSPVPRKANFVDIEPLIQTWKFLPYLDTEETHVQESENLKICVDIVLENLVSKCIKVNEIGSEINSEDEIISKVKETVTRIPLRSTMMTQAPCDFLIVHSIQDLNSAKGLLQDNGFVLFLSSNFQTFDLSKSWVILTERKWRKHLMILLRKRMDPSHLDEIVIPINNDNYDWLPLLQQALSAVTPTTRIWLTTSEVDTGLIGFVNCIRKEPGGSAIRCIVSSHPQLTMELKQADLVMNIMKDGMFGSYRSLSFPSHANVPSSHAYLNVLRKGDLSSVTWIEAPKPTQGNLNENYCTVHYAPLNFRDIMIAVGKLSPDSLPGDAGKQDCVLGLEFVGLDLKQRRVMGAVSSKGLAAYVKPDPNLVWPVPEKWRMVEAATVPIVYSTAYYSLVMRGRIRRGESILITSGAGGVGQAAIAIAQSFSCDIFTTVGSNEKKAWLHKRFPKIKEDHILNSRSTDFAHDILKLTAGRGVDIVLNSLAEEKLQAALSAVATGGRFLEIGKVDLFNNTGLGMEIFLRNISFHGILLDALFQDSPQAIRDKKEVLRLVSEGIEEGTVQPLPYTLFSYSEAEAAFRFMASGKHVGKVVLELRSEDSTDPPLLSAIPRTYFDPKKTYAILGGLGGFGIEMASWIISRGAKKLAFLSRSGVSTGYQALQIKRWREGGVNVIVSMNELLLESDVQTLLEKWNQHGPIGGIFNLAMVLKDGAFENQNEEDFEMAMKPKLRLTRLFDKVSQICCPELEHFVVFSSVSSVIGNAGQSNYGMANSSMERIVEARRKRGLPGLAIAWGAIGDVGVVHEQMGSTTLIVGTIPQPLLSCLRVLDNFLHHKTQSTCRSGIVSSILLPKGNEGEKIGAMVSKTLREQAARILGLTDSVFAAKKNVPLSELGMDSLMITEVKQLLEEHKVSLSSKSAIRQLTWEALQEFENNHPKTQIS